MAPNSPTTRAASLLWLCRVLLLIAACVSAYLLYGSITGERLPGCGLESGCSDVLRTKWAYIGPVPVSLPALLLYLGMLALSFRLPPGTLGKAGAPISERKRSILGSSAPLLRLAAAMLVMGALYFVALQLFVIRAICPFCMAAHACGLVVGILILVGLRSPNGRAKGYSFPIGTALAAIVVTAALQASQKEKTFSVASGHGLAAQVQPRIIEFHGGAIQVDLRDTPLHGSPDATNVIVHIFDYTCPHCRQLHPVLKKLHERLSNHIAIASLLVPLATNCNRLAKRPIPQHVTACELAFAGLAVWRSDRGKLPAFEDWVFASVKPPTPEAALGKGRELVGTNEFNTALLDRWITNHLARNIDLYESNYVRFRKSILPELMIGTNLISGAVSTPEQLLQLLGLPSPAASEK